MMRRWCLFCLVLLSSLVSGQAVAEFPRPPEISTAVEFWTSVYSEVGTDGGLLHDRDDLDVVYETLSFEENLWHPARERKIRERRNHYRQILRTLAGGKREDLSPEQARVLALWPEDVSGERLRRAAGNIRFQLGQADRFREGLVRAGAWKPYIHETLDELDLPRELMAIAHVESSFNPDAWSRVGAAGIWQFTRATGRQYMQVDHVLDQRMDPFAATKAAGLLLRHNYSVAEDWGQAITAYNHGLAGIRRAVRKTGSENIGEIIANYEGRNWGFASRNFYPAFLAAVEVDRNAEKYFPGLEPREPLRTTTVELPFYVPISAVLETFSVSRETLRELNRGLREPVWSGRKHVPRGYELRLPAGEVTAPGEQLASIGEEQRYFRQVPDREHRVRPGEALSTIAARYNTSVRELMAMNNLSNRHHVRAGQTLRLPVDGEAAPIEDTHYRVRSGDNLSRIAYRAGMSVSALAAANGIDPEKPIRPGMELRVDGKAAEGVTTLAGDAGDPSREATRSEPLVTRAMFRSEGEEGLAGEVAATVASLTRPSPQPGPAADELGGDETDVRVSESPMTEMPTDDPTDYRVAEDATIEVQAAETLGHYAEWLELRASDLRRTNNMSFRSPLVIGERLELVFSETTPEEFEQRRKRYHRDLQASFFERHQIDDTRTHRIERGESLWHLTQPNTDVPVWLLRQHNPDMDFASLQPGTEIRVPVVHERENP